jgi:hypothetical protein
MSQSDESPLERALETALFTGGPLGVGASSEREHPLAGARPTKPKQSNAALERCPEPDAMRRALVERSR